MWNPLDSLASDRTSRAASSLLGGLIYKPSTRGLDDAMLVGFGGIAMPFPISKPLHHSHTDSLSLSLSLPAAFLLLCFLGDAKLDPFEKNPT